MRKSDVKTGLAALLLVALLPCVAGAAGLGRLTVLSSIGQPLIAEIDLSATREELASVDARLALPDTYRQANLQYNVALAGARISVEKRPNGQAYVRIVSTRPVAEPFVDLLIELRWSSGRLSREYTALLDPPGIPMATPAAPVLAVVPQAAPAAASAPTPEPAAAPVPAQPQAPAAAEPQPPVAAGQQPPAAAEPQPQVAAAAPAMASPAPVATPVARAGSRDYGPIERGETLGKIARSVMPEGVTLEQMLVALYRTNSDAFIRKNLNLVRTGKVLRVPDRDEIETIARDDAVQEYRAHVADWNTYRQKLADAAGTVPAEGRPAASGKITTKVEDKAPASAPKDVVRLSKSEPVGAAGKGKPRNPADQVRALEEELVARDRALAEANSRIAQLEKTVKDMQKLMELKSPGMAAAQAQAQKPAAKPEAKPAVPAKPEAKKPEAVAVAKPEPAKPAAAAPEPKPAVVTPEAKKPEQAAAPAPKPVTKPAAKAPPKPEPSIVDEIIEAATDPVYLGAGGGVIVIGGLAFWMVRRRRNRADAGDRPPIAPTLSRAAATAAGAAAGSDTDAAAAAAPATDDVDPLAEAEVYIQYGRDGQAEEILKEALAKDPKREDVQLKLLEIYATRKDKGAFEKLARSFNTLTGGAGDNWIKAAAMGYTLDSANSLYAAGKDAAATTLGAGAGGAAADIDLDLGGGGTGTATDITLDAGAVDASILDLGAADAPAKAPDFTLEVPPAGGGDGGLDVPAPAAAPAPAQDTGMIDFQIELPKLDAQPATIVAASPAALAATDGGLDFKLEIPDLDLGDKPKAGAAGGGEKDSHWYDIQTKFDLAKAYQEMGDRDGAKEILKEVIKDGDAEQKAQAKTLLDSLS